MNGHKEQITVLDKVPLSSGGDGNKLWEDEGQKCTMHKMCLTLQIVV